MKRRLAALAISISACRDSAQPSPAPPPESAIPKPSDSTAPLPAKLGLRFVPVEETDGGTSWLASSPIRCSAGEHDLVRCLTITPLAADRRGQDSDTAIAAEDVIVADAATAHRLCAQRFGGRLPSVEQRARQQVVHGLSSLLVVQTQNPAERFRYLELPEWTEQGECDNPVRPGPECRLAVFPAESAANALRSGELRCTARRVQTSTGLLVIDLGEACPRRQALSPDGGAETLPCLLRMPGASPAEPPALYALSCRQVDTDKPPLNLDLPLGAYRCLVPAMAFGQAPATR